MEFEDSQKLKDARIRIGKYCAYQERSHQEVRDKLYNLGLYKQEVESLIAEMIELDYLNEERFARAYCRGKFLHNKWGRRKILQGLKQKGVSQYCIKKGLEEIKESDYLATLELILNKQLSKHRGSNTYIQSNKAARYAIQKGFESALVWQFVNQQSEQD